MSTIVILVSTSGSTQTYNVPSDWNSASNKVEAIGGGASGAFGTQNQSNGAGAYTFQTNVPLTPGGTTSFQIGLSAAAGTSTNTNGFAGTDTWFVSNTTVLAKAGSVGTTTTPGVGGLAANCIPSANAHSGGTGAAGNADAGGSGGAGAGGSTGAGKNGGGQTAAGAGGGGANAGSSTAGNSGTGSTGGLGGTGPTGTSGGTAGTGGATATAGGPGSNGSGGGGGGEATGSNAGGAGGLGGPGIDMAGGLAGAGGGGGGGGSTSGGTAGQGGAGGLYGGSGGAGGFNGSSGGGNGGIGGQGVIVLTYTPAVASTGWLPSYPDLLQGNIYVRNNIAEDGDISFDLGQFTGETIFPDKWLPNYPASVPGKKVFQDGFSVSPWGNIAVPIFPDKWLPDFPDKTPKRELGVFQTGEFDTEIGIFTLETINPDKWLPSYPDTTRGKHEFQTGVMVSGPVIELITMDKWFPHFPDSAKGKTEFPQGHFAWPADIATKEGFIGKWYPDFPDAVPRRHPGEFPQGQFSHIPFTLPVIVFPDKYYPVYVDRVPRLPTAPIPSLGDFRWEPIITNNVFYQRTCAPTEAPVPPAQKPLEQPHDCGTVTVVVSS